MMAVIRLVRICMIERSYRLPGRHGLHRHSKISHVVGGSELHASHICRREGCSSGARGLETWEIRQRARRERTNKYPQYWKQNAQVINKAKSACKRVCLVTTRLWMSDATTGPGGRPQQHKYKSINPTSNQVEKRATVCGFPPFFFFSFSLSNVTLI